MVTGFILKSWLEISKVFQDFFSGSSVHGFFMIHEDLRNEKNSGLLRIDQGS